MLLSYTKFIFFIVLGIGIFAWGSRIERHRDNGITQTKTQISLVRQLISGVILVFQLCMAFLSINFLIVIVYGIYSKELFKDLLLYLYFLVPSVLFFLAYWVRRKLRDPILK